MALDRLRSYTISLTAGVDFPVNVDGDFFFAHSNASPYDILFDSENSFINTSVGARIKFVKPYQRFVLTSSNTQSVRIIVGYGDYDNTVEAVLAFLIPATLVSTTADVTVGSTATLISAQNSLRREIGITVPDGADTGIRWGDSNVTATRGKLLLPGMAAFFGTTAAIYGVRAGSTDVDVSITEFA